MRGILPTVGAWSPDGAEIAALAQSVLHKPAATVADWRVEPVDYDFGSPTTDGLFRILGEARVGGFGRPWSAFVKQIRSYRHWPLVEILPADLRAAAFAGDHWQYEADVYRSGLAGALPDGLRLPVVHRIVDLGDDRLAIVLEDVACSVDRWDDRRFATAATLLGRFAVRATRHDSLPSGFYTGRLLPAAFPALAADALWRHPLLADAAGVRRDLGELAGRVPAILDAVEPLPQLFGHGDASPQNLLVPADGSAAFVVIDWTLGGLAAVGDDLGQLLVGLAHAGELDVTRLPALHDILLSAYRAGLDAEGMPVDERLIRQGMDAGLVVRSAFTALPLERAHEPITDELTLLWRDRLGLTRYLVDLGLSLPH
jgi:hypothetical protein